MHKHPYPSSLALTGFFAQSQTHLIAPAAGGAIIFAVPLHPPNPLALSLANAVGSDLTTADAHRKHDRFKHRPGDYETVRRLLGHRNIWTTIKFYCGLETMEATQQFGKLIREHIQFDADG